MKLKTLVTQLCNHVVLYKGKNFQIVTYGFLYGIAALVVSQMFYTLWFSQNGPLSQGFLLYISIAIPLFTVLFSKLIYLLYNLKRLMKTPLQVLNETGYAFFGGFFGIFLAVYLGEQWFYPGRFLNILDFVFLSLPLGQILQRIGCLTYGCCYGDFYDGPIAIHYTNPDAKAYKQVGERSLHPTQIYSIIKNVALFTVLLTMFITLPYPGLPFAMWLILYSLLRFFVDFTRYTRDIFFIGLRFSQFFSLIIFVCGLYLLTHISDDPYVFSQPLAHSALYALRYFPYSLISFFIFFICYGYHGSQLGLYYVGHANKT